MKCGGRFQDEKYEIVRTTNERAAFRALMLAELTEVMRMARRIATLLLMQLMLDANYQAVRAEGCSRPKVPKVRPAGAASGFSEPLE